MTKNKKMTSGRITYFLMTLIPVILYSFFYIVSVISGVRYSFTNWNGMSKTFDYIGISNYKLLFKNKLFWGSVKTTALYCILFVSVVILASLTLSIALNSLTHCKTLFKSIYFVPAMIGGVTISMIWDVMFYRVVPLIGQALGIEWLSQSVLMTGKTALPAVVFVQSWQAIAMPTVIFIAGLQQIPDEQYESAKIDGANAFARFRYITMPSLLPTLVVNLILQMKAGFTTFDFPYALTGGGPARATQVIGILIYKDAFANSKFSMANAESCVLFVVMATFSFIQLKITNRGGKNQ